MSSTNQQIPDPMPHEFVGDIGHQLWVWAARFAPAWLATQPDPESLFQAINDRVLAKNEHQVRALLAENHDRSRWHEVSDSNLARLLSELHLPPAEVSQPVWDGHSDGFDPDGPPDFPLG